MMQLAAAYPAATALLAALLGLGLGVVHFASLRRVTDLYLGPGRAPARALALQLARLALLVAVFVLLAGLGAYPLLAGAAGLVLGRALVLRRARAEERGEA
ncbi:ATP synthase subunit I [Pseudooceanicola sp. 200-1SW]|uniref:N-ATPase subunit AtpR n=1 Tax=Pseudooceanicola sp. 200-1SW TaxID=3425949 RepID=UPI003D7FE2BF